MQEPLYTLIPLDPKQGTIAPGLTLREALAAEIVLGTRVAETILASGHVRPHKQAGHMIASGPIKSLLNQLASRRPSTYVF